MNLGRTEDENVLKFEPAKVILWMRREIEELEIMQKVTNMYENNVVPSSGQVEILQKTYAIVNKFIFAIIMFLRK